MKINPIGHLVKTNPIRTQSKPISEKAKMNVTSIITKAYENISNWAICENEPNQSRSEAEIPTGELLGILKPGTNFKG